VRWLRVLGWALFAGNVLFLLVDFWRPTCSRVAIINAVAIGVLLISLCEPAPSAGDGGRG